jgi:hypothetical protein
MNLACRNSSMEIQRIENPSSHSANRTTLAKTLSAGQLPTAMKSIIPRRKIVLASAVALQFLLQATAFASSDDTHNVAPAKKQVDTSNSVPPPTYDSEANSILSDDGYNTPEADGRPGEYFFKIAVIALNKKNFDHAIDMYKLAAYWAYKPAEYNLGVMYFKGQGVAVNRPLGAAWTILSAERNDSLYVQASNLMVQSLSKAEFDEADKFFGELQPTYADATALRRAKARWAETRSQMTGSHVGGASGQLRVGAIGSGFHVPSAAAKTGGSALSHMDTSGSEITGGYDSPGAVAYRQFSESDNPYDPKFRNNPIPITTVGPLEQIESESVTTLKQQKGFPSSSSTVH